MNLKRAYYYLFYKFYQFAEASPSTLPSDYVAAVTIGWLEVMLWASLKLYYSEIFHEFDHLSFISFQILVPFFIIAIANYWAFIHNENWKVYFKKFDKLSEEKNDNGTLVVIGVVLFVILNFVIGAHFSPLIK